MVFWSNFIKKIKNAVSKERVDKLEQKINTNATNIELLEQDIDTNTNSISDIKNNITNINSSINELDTDITRIENSLTNTNNELDSLEARVNGYDDRINEANTKASEANTKATQAEEQATRLGLTVSNNSTKIVALEGKTNNNQTNIENLANRVNANTNSINAMLQVKKMTVNFSQFSHKATLPNTNRITFMNWNYQLTSSINYSRVVAMVPVIEGGTTPEFVIMSPKIYKNNFIELPCVHFQHNGIFQIAGHLTILYI